MGGDTIVSGDRLEFESAKNCGVPGLPKSGVQQLPKLLSLLRYGRAILVSGSMLSKSASTQLEKCP